MKKVKVSRAALRQEAKERVDLFLAIGEFVFEYSQLVFTIRFALATALNIPENAFSALTSMYDFRALCRVTAAVLEEAVAPTQRDLEGLEEEEEVQKKLKVQKERIAEVFEACRGIHDERNRIVEGTWSIGCGARHVSRTSLKPRDYFEKPEKIVERTLEVQKLKVNVLRLLGFKPPEDRLDRQGSNPRQRG